MLHIFPKVLLCKVFGREVLSGQISHAHGIVYLMETVWVVGSRRRLSAHAYGDLLLRESLSQLADGSERALQLSEASGRQCSQTGKHRKGKHPLTWVAEPPRRPKNSITMNCC